MGIIDEYEEAFKAFVLLTPEERIIITRQMEQMLAERKRIAKRI